MAYVRPCVYFIHFTMKGEHAKKNIKMVALVALLVVFFFGRGVEGIERRVGVKEKKLSIASQFFGDVETETLFAQVLLFFFFFFSFSFVFLLIISLCPVFLSFLSPAFPCFLFFCKFL